MTKRDELMLLGEIAGEAAHELRNALAVISASASLIKPAGLSPADAAHLAKIERNARLAQSVLDAMMSLARGEAVRGASVVLANAMRSARAEIRAEESGAIEYEDDVGEVAVRGSDVLLERMFRVLYDNAAQAGGKKITTRGRAGENGAVTIDVIDDGPGIPESIRDTLFEPLVTTKHEDGRMNTGLGLALARRVARAHGGDIALGDSARGAHFVITLRA